MKPTSLLTLTLIGLAMCIGNSTGTFAAELVDGQTINLWPGPAPGALGNGPADTPAVQVFLPTAGKACGAAMVVCPGGGYGTHAPHEAGVVGRWFASNGITAFVLRYRLGPKYRHPIPLTDAQRAIRFVRANAKQWKLDPARIGIMGFSAGGHLASTAATHYDAGRPDAEDPVERVSCRPDVQILIYPVISMGPQGHAGSRNNLLGPNPPPELIDLLSNEKQVTIDTPPAFLMHSVKDQTVPVANSDMYVEALKRAGVRHLYVRGDLGPHGVGLKDTWTPQCLEWLRAIGFLTGPATAPAPPSGAGSAQSNTYVAWRFDAAEGWTLRVSGPAGSSRLEGGKLIYDFTKGATSVGISPPDMSLLGTPQEFRIRVRGKAPGHPVRMRVATHFMTFERVIGEFSGDGEYDLVATAPPGEGWRWFGGENDGKLHGPLRIAGIYLDRGERADAGELELVHIAVRTTFGPAQACVLTADLRGDEFVATARSLLETPVEGELSWTIRGWSGTVLAERKEKLPLPGGAVPVKARMARPAGGVFQEAEMSLNVPGQKIPVVWAYYVAPIEPRLDTRIDVASPFGMGLYLNRYGGDEEGLRLMDQAARMGAEAGVKWSREGISWPRVEPRKGQYDWTYYDKLVATARRYGISIYALISSWAPWTKPYTPEGIDDYCRFAAAAAEHYRNEIKHWEVWNEPNIFFWQGPRDMYAELLKKAYAAIKKANPDALVLGCSTAGIDYNFIKRVMDLGAPFDILTIHPYRRTMDDRAFVRDLRKAADLVKLPDGSIREVWITEMGWATHVPHNTLSQDFAPNSPRRQAELLARSYINAVATGVSPNISWYDFRNDGTCPFYFEHNMGVVMRDFRPKPAYRALATVTRMLKGKRPQEHPDLGTNIVAYRFAADGRREPALLAMWALKEPQTAALPGRSGRIIDLMGTTTSAAVEGGRVMVPLAPERPVFAEIE